MNTLAAVKAIAASGSGIAVALKIDGTVWRQWEGLFEEGWVQVDNLNNVVAIASDLALKSDGTLWQFDSNSPTMTDVVAISESLALRSDGSVWEYQIDTDNDEYNWVRINGLTGVSSLAGHGSVPWYQMNIS